MFKQTKIEVFENGEWKPVVTKTDYKKIGYFVLLIILACGAVFGGLWARKRISKAFYAQNHNESRESITAEPDKHLAGLFGISDKYYLSDNFGNIYNFVEDKLKLTDKKAVRLNEKETIAAIESDGSDNLLAINNSENEELVKFILVSDAGKATEEKVFYKSRLTGRHFGKGLFLTTGNHIIWRKAPADYLALKSPLRNETVADLKSEKNSLYLLGSKDSVFRINISDSNSTENSWQQLIQGNSDEAEDGITPFFIQVYPNRLLLFSNDKTLEEYSIKNDQAEMKYFISYDALIKKKPDSLAAFKIISLENFPMPDVWCLTSRELTKCPSLGPDFRVYRLDDAKLVISKGENFWTKKL